MADYNDGLEMLGSDIDTREASGDQEQVKLIASLVEKNIHQFAARDVAVQVLHNSAFALLQTVYNLLITEYTVAKYELHIDDTTEGLTAANEWAVETLAGMVKTVYEFKKGSIPDTVALAKSAAGEDDDIDWSQA